MALDLLPAGLSLPAGARPGDIVQVVCSEPFEQPPGWERAANGAVWRRLTAEDFEEAQAPGVPGATRQRPDA